MPIKSPSGEQNSTDVNQSHALSDHLTTKLVPMSIHDIQNCDVDFDILEKDGARLRGMHNTQQKREKHTEQTLTRHEKDRQSRYLLRNQRMRLFSPIIKAKYQHEVLLRQSEQIDLGADGAESSMGNESDRLPTMLRVLRAVSPTQEYKDQRLLKTRGAKSISQG